MSMATERRSDGATQGGALLVFALLLGSALVAGEPPQGDERFTVIKAGRIVTNAGKEIRDGVIVLSGGKIHNVGMGIEYPVNAQVIDAHDRTVMPGLIDPSTRIGLPAYQRAEVHGDWSAASEDFLGSVVYEEVLDAGYTALALVPAGSGVPGRAVVVRTGGPVDQRVLLSPGYLRVTPDKKIFRGALEKAQQEIEKVDKARQEFEKKQQEQKPPTQPASQPGTQPASQPAFQPPPIDPAHQVLVELIQKKPDLFALLELGNASDYVQMSDVLKKFDIAHHYLARIGGESDLGYVVAKLGEEKAKIILQPVISRVPASVERLHVVRMLAQAGCEVSLMPVSDTPLEFQRMLGRVANLVREGWSREEALKAVTLNPARLLGLDKRLGSIEKDKEADFIFLDGDPLDPRTHVREVMILGEIVHRAEVPE